MSTFSVKGVLSLDGSQFAGAMSQANRSVDRFATSVSRAVTARVAGLFTLGAAEEGIRRTIQFASHIQDLSQRLGVSVEWLQEMQYIMKQNGGTADDLAKVLEKVSDNRKLALAGKEGSPGMLQKFGQLGIDAQQLSTTGSQGLVEAMAAAFKRGGSTETLSNAFREIGGRGARNLVASFVDGIDEGREAARKSGAIMSEDVIAQLDDLGDRFTQLEQQIIVSVGPAILKLVGFLQALWDKIIEGAAAIQGFMEKANWKTVVAVAADPFNLWGLQNTPNAGEAFQNAGDRAQAARDIAEKDKLDAAAELYLKKKNLKARQAPDKIDIQTYVPKEAKSHIESDSLTSIGNFLGSNTQNTLARLAQRQVDLLSSIDRNISNISNNGGSVNDGFEND